MAVVSVGKGIRRVFNDTGKTAFDKNSLSSAAAFDYRHFFVTMRFARFSHAFPPLLPTKRPREQDEAVVLLGHPRGLLTPRRPSVAVNHRTDPSVRPPAWRRFPKNRWFNEIAGPADTAEALRR